MKILITGQGKPVRECRHQIRAVGGSGRERDLRILRARVPGPPMELPAGFRNRCQGHLRKWPEDIQRGGERHIAATDHQTVTASQVHKYGEEVQWCYLRP